MEIVCGTTGIPTSDCILQRVTVGSTSACRKILGSFRFVVFLVAQTPYAARGHHLASTAPNMFQLHTPNDRPGAQHGASTSLRFSCP
ncbi:hypothetical protein AVEN_250552-1 [Araneus ventricosus]|uniref:Uncharacterized protein n=1 Tax=Araneus ventricosus TaxID=182803 RepID=A0A4Y2FST4_ARAVE|nr:hypothetical protein AVEN_250552-1 [Araneus ventricosus]